MCFETQLAKLNIKLYEYLLPRARCGELPLFTRLPRRVILGNSRKLKRGGKRKRRGLVPVKGSGFSLCQVIRIASGYKTPR
jgi:hypothetical protein